MILLFYDVHFHVSFSYASDIEIIKTSISSHTLFFRSKMIHDLCKVNRMRKLQEWQVFTAS